MNDPGLTSLWLDTLRALLAFALPWLLGTLVIALVAMSSPTQSSSPPAGQRALLLGSGYLAGWVLLTLLMRCSDGLGFGLHPLKLLILITSLIGILAWALARWPPGTIRDLWINPAWISRAWHDQPSWQRVLSGLLATMIAVRLGGLWLEVFWRPLFPWDAAMHWATKARVWFSLGEMVPFVDDDTWLTLGGQGVFTDNHPDYPPTIPLMQTWMALLIGHWNDALINLPWAGLGLALGLSFFAQARRAGAEPLVAMLFSYFLVSLPLLNTHIALAGYADLFLGATLLYALMALHNGIQNGERVQRVLAIGFALAAPLIKQEGLIWLMCFLPALATLWLPRPWLWGLIAGAGFGFIALIISVPRELSIAGHSLQELQLGFHPEAISPLLNSLFVFDSWHLLFWVTGALILLRLVLLRRPWPTALLAIGLMLATAFTLIMVLFLGTTYANSMPGYTSVSRITLHFAPSLVFFCLILYLDLAQPDSSSSQQVPGT